MKQSVWTDRAPVKFFPIINVHNHLNQRFQTQWFSSGTLETDHLHIREQLLTLVLNIINPFHLSGN